MGKVEQRELTATELKRRGFMVTNSADGGFLVEKNTFWGRFCYDTKAGLDNSRIKWGRTLLLMIVYGVGFVGGLYWLWQKGNLKSEVISVTSGVV